MGKFYCDFELIIFSDGHFCDIRIEKSFIDFIFLNLIFVNTWDTKTQKQKQIALKKCKVTFIGIKSSKQIVYGPLVNGHGPENTVMKEGFDKLEGKFTLYGLEGVISLPGPGWIDWEIEAQNFYLEASEKDIKNLLKNGVNIKLMEERKN